MRTAPKFLLTVFLFFLFALPLPAFAHQPRLIYNEEGDIQIKNPEISQAFYDELSGQTRNYFITSESNFVLYVNLLVPESTNISGRYSANIFSGNEKIDEADGFGMEWPEYYEEFGRDYYLKGPELERQLSAGSYRIEVFSPNNEGKYVLAVGKTESYDLQSLLNIYWQLPMLKMQFFQTDMLQLLFTPFGVAAVGAVGGILIFLAVIYYLAGLIGEAIKHRKVKTLLLTSNGMQMKSEIIKLLQKPAYDITVAFINTAAKPESDLSYVEEDWKIMREELGFNVEEIDIEGKKEEEVMELLKHKDIIYVEGGNTFYLLRAMRACNFEKIIKKLLKKGSVYIGVSAGSMVAGRTIKTAGWKREGDHFGVKNLRGLGLVPFDIFVHFRPEHADIIKSKIPWKWQRRKLRILTDEQAILVQGREVDLIGKGNKIVV
jgi:peptidase E